MSLGNSLTNALFSKGALVDLDIGRWAGIKKLQNEDLLLSTVDNNAVYLGHKKLLPKSSLSKVIEKEQRARSNVLKLTSHFPISGTRFATFPMLPQIIEKLEIIKVEWEAALKDFLSEYENSKDKQLKVLDEFYEQLKYDELQKTSSDKRVEKEKELLAWLEKKKEENQKLYPPKECLEAKFSFTWRIFKIEPIDGKMEAKALAEAQNKLEADLKAWVQDACAEMHKALGEAAHHAQVLLEKQGKLNTKNLKPLFDAFEVFTKMDFVGSPFKSTIQNVKGYLNIDATGLNDEVDWKATSEHISSSPEAFGNLLKTLGDLAVEEMAKQAGVDTVYNTAEFKRLVEL